MYNELMVLGEPGKRLRYEKNIVDYSVYYIDGFNGLNIVQ